MDQLQYFVKRTDQRLDQIDEKLDKIISFKFMILGGSAAISFIVHCLFLIYELKK